MVHLLIISLLFEIIANQRKAMGDNSYKVFNLASWALLVFAFILLAVSIISDIMRWAS